MTVEGSARQSECAHIAAGVARTVAGGSAEVMVLLEYSFPGEAADDALPAAMSSQYRGVVDFRSNRGLAEGSEHVTDSGRVATPALSALAVVDAGAERDTRLVGGI